MKHYFTLHEVISISTVSVYGVTFISDRKEHHLFCCNIRWKIGVNEQVLECSFSLLIVDLVQEQKSFMFNIIKNVKRNNGILPGVALMLTVAVCVEIMHSSPFVVRINLSESVVSSTFPLKVSTSFPFRFRFFHRIVVFY